MPGIDTAPRALPLRTWNYLARVRRFEPNARLFLLGSMLMGIAHGAIFVHMNLYYRALGLNEATIGRILSASSLGTVLIAIPSALVADRIPAERVFTMAAIGFAGLLSLMLLVHHVWLLILLSLVTGMLFTVHNVAMAPFFMRNARSEDRIYLFGFANAVENGSAIVAALGVGWLAHEFTRSLGTELLGLRAGLFTVVILALLAAFPFARIRSTPPPQESRSWRGYLAARDWGLLARLTVPGALVGLGAGLVIPFLNLYFRDRFGQGPEKIGGYFAVSEVLTVLGMLSGPPIARRIGPVAAMVTTELLSIPFFLILAFAHNLPLAVFAFWMRGALMNMNHPIKQAFTMEQVPADQQAVTNSVGALAWSSCWMISAQAGGWMIERRGFTAPMLVTIGLYVVSAAMYWSFFGRRRPLRG